MEVNPEMLPICRANELEIQPPDQLWLIEPLWAQCAVGIIGGAPKCCKSWLALDMALSVASATPCLGRFPVKQPGPALIFLAEDANSAVRTRIEALCAHRQLDIEQLNLYVITASTLRLDLEHDQKRLQATVAALRPRLLLLDPLVRLHRLDENSAADISKLLGFVREMQRSYDTAVVLVHHASKKHRAQPGQALRGSSDLHAFGDSNAYLARHKQRIVLTLEHRCAKAIDPIEMQLVTGPDDADTHLEITTPNAITTGVSLAERTLLLLQNSPKPLTRTSIRKQLRVNNQRLGETLVNLGQQGLILQTSKGWVGLLNNHPEAQQLPLL
jgi:hypothetical protein